MEADAIRYDAKAWLIKLQEDGRGYSAIHSIRGVVRPAFQLAVENDLLPKSLFEFQLNTVVVNDSAIREAISRQQERAFLEFVRNDPHFCKYYEGIFVLFKAGLRISEFVGLTVDDLDFENNRIIVDHQLQRTRNMEYVIEPTKTSCSTRMVPMTPDVRDVLRPLLRTERSRRKNPSSVEKPFPLSGQEWDTHGGSALGEVRCSTLWDTATSE